MEFNNLNFAKHTAAPFYLVLKLKIVSIFENTILILEVKEDLNAKVIFYFNKSINTKISIAKFVSIIQKIIIVP